MLSLLTPEYRKRMVQQNYHEVVNNSPQWDASFCYPEGFMRWWAEASLGGDIEVMMTPDRSSSSAASRTTFCAAC